jgi:hypothetical protein
MYILELLLQSYIEFVSINYCFCNRRLTFVKIFQRNCNTWHGFSLFRLLLFDLFLSVHFPCFFDLRISYIFLVVMSILGFFFFYSFRLPCPVKSLFCSAIFCCVIWTVLKPNTQWCTIIEVANVLEYSLTQLSIRQFMGMYFQSHLPVTCFGLHNWSHLQAEDVSMCMSRNMLLEDMIENTFP